MVQRTEAEHLLPDTEFVCFVIPALFSKEECAELLTPEVKMSFQSAIANYPTYYRNNDRQVVDSEDLAARLFRKVGPHLPATIETNSTIEKENGLWRLHRLNSRLRFCRYRAHQYFNRHLDGIHYHSETEQSKLTFMIYLNGAEEFEGGNTLFYKTKTTDQVWASYVPRQGDLIVFDHNIWHEGAILHAGEKFVLRSDIMYTRAVTAAATQPFSGHLGYIWKLLKFSDNIFVSGGRDKVIKIWDNNGLPVQDLKAHNNSILCIEKINNTTFVTGSRDKQIIVWQQNGAEGFCQMRTINIHSALVLSLCRLTDSIFASSSGDGTICICDLEGNMTKVLREHNNWVWHVIKLGEHIIASCSEDGTIKLWDVRSGIPVMTFTEGYAIFCLGYIASGRKLISGNLHGDVTIRTLDESLGQQGIHTFKAHNGIIRTIEIIDDHRIATGGEDNRIKIWDMDTHTLITELEHQNFVQSIVAIDAHTLMSASYDGTIRTWRLGGVDTLKQDRPTTATP